MLSNWHSKLHAFVDLVLYAFYLGFNGISTLISNLFGSKFWLRNNNIVFEINYFRLSANSCENSWNW